jgi:hypothetical protein
MKEIARFYPVKIFVILSLITWCTYGASPLYAEEYYIAESFGFYSKGIQYYHEGRLHEAKNTLEHSIMLDPGNDEAQGYLDLVNAELRMRAKGRLDFYQHEDTLERESDPGEKESFEDIDIYEPEDEAFDEIGTYEPEEDRDPIYRYYEPKDETFETRYYEPGDENSEYRYFGRPRPMMWPQRPLEYPEDKIKAIAEVLNDNISPGKISGEYKMSFGLTTDDLIWKKANGDYNERNSRMIDHDFPKTNTFDTRVFDRFKVVFDTNEGDEGLNLHSDITIDPWSFVGKTEKFTLTGSAGDRVELEFKYWSGTRSAINEIFYTLDKGGSFATSEYKVSDGKLPSFSINSVFDNVVEDTFTIPQKTVDFTFQPLRELWFDYSKDDYRLRVFPYGLENQALSSDDPLGLSNHHVYWEPSPWLDDWIPGHYNSNIGALDFWRGNWSDTLSFFTRDSDLKRLTALRGISFQGNLSEGTELSATIATPKGLWQDYETITSIPAAIRTKTYITDRWMVGLIDTFRMGVDRFKISGDAGKQVDSYNNVFGIDTSYDFNPATNIVGEFAMSKSDDDRSSAYRAEKNGSAAHIAIKNKSRFGDARLAFTHMDKGFDAGLANYTETRKDMHWGRHIHFKKPLEYLAFGVGKVRYDDIKAFRIGDGIDIGRKALNFGLDTRGVFSGRMHNLIDYRYVRDSDHKYVEGVFREENTFKFSPEWTSKFLLIHHDLPKTKGGIDPILYNSDTGEFLENTAIEDGKDPSVSTYSFGMEYAPEDWMSIFGIYENSNDYKFSTGDHPNGLLNNTYLTTETIDGKVYRKEVPFLYSQGFFDLPPYERFHIYRAGVSLKPLENLRIDFDYTKNDFKFAAGIDDDINHFGTTLNIRFNPRLTGFLKYTYSKLYNLYRLNTSGDLKYEDHHNVFIEANYDVTDYGFLTLQFGEGSVLSPIWDATASPYGDFYPALDTQHILRVYYHGRF